ncbi:MAG: hypothetical protein MPJ50_05870 [Pirellulales bacterium]|nr:hypothetical protein [Pirellulales bacterium]
MINPYLDWLNLPSDGARPDHYMLLGLSKFEQSATKIDKAAQRQVAMLKPHVVKDKALVQRLLREIDEARRCLLDPAQRADYDGQLRVSLGSALAAPTDPAQGTPSAKAAPVDQRAADLLPPGATPTTLVTPSAKRGAEASQSRSALITAVAQSTTTDSTDKPRTVRTASTGGRPRRSGPSPVLIWGTAAAMFLLLGGIGFYLAGRGPFAAEKFAANHNAESDDHSPAPNNSQNEPAVRSKGDLPLKNGRPTNSGQSGKNSANGDIPQAKPVESIENIGEKDSSASSGRSEATDGRSPVRRSDPLDAATVEILRTTLQESRQALGDRNFELAEQKIAAAAALDPEGEFARERDAARLLAQLVGSFWGTVRNSVDTLQAADQIEVAGVPIGIVEVDGDGLRIRRDGTNERYDYATMPSGFAYALGEYAYQEESTSKNLVLAAFLIADPRANHAQAEKMLAAAEAENPQSVELLRTELQLAILTDAAQPDTTPPPTESVSPPSESVNADVPRFGAKVAPPEGEVLMEALLKLKSEHDQALGSAQEPNERRKLANTFRDAAKKEPDTARRYALLQLAVDQASFTGDVNATLLLLDVIGDYFEVDVLKLKSAELTKLARGSAETRATVAQSALDLADDAVVRERYAESVQLARTAQVAARGLGNAELLKAASERAVAFGQLAREERSR